MKTNFDVLKEYLKKKIDKMTERDLYYHILEPDPLIRNACERCVEVCGPCSEEDKEDDTVCISRFFEWCWQPVECKEQTTDRRYQFKPDQAYRLTSVTGIDGKPKRNRQDFYNRYIGRVCVEIKYDDEPDVDGVHRSHLFFEEYQEDHTIKSYIHTSGICGVEENDTEVKIYTRNTVYHLEKLCKQEVLHGDENYK